MILSSRQCSNITRETRESGKLIIRSSNELLLGWTWSTRQRASVVDVDPRYGSLRDARRSRIPRSAEARGPGRVVQQILGYTHCEQKVLALPVHGQLVLPAIQNQLAAIIKRQEFTPTEDAGFSKCASAGPRPHLVGRGRSPQSG